MPGLLACLSLPLCVGEWVVVVGCAFVVLDRLFETGLGLHEDKGFGMT